MAEQAKSQGTKLTSDTDRMTQIDQGIMNQNPLAKIKAKLIAKYGKEKGMDIYRSASKDISNQIAGGGGEIEGSPLTQLMDSSDQVDFYEYKSNLAQGKASGGAITKNRMGANDYRSGGYVLNTTDNRKVKRNGK